MKKTWGVVLAAWTVVACNEPSTSERVGVRTLEDLSNAAGTPESFDGLKPQDFITRSGQAIPLLSPPFTASDTLQLDGIDGINVLPAFSEGASAAYTIQEVWKDVPEVWVQPWWVMVTGWNPANPGSLRLPNSKAVIHVGTESIFYSPFWEVIYAEVNADTPTDQFRSSGEVLRWGLPLHGGNGIFALLAPLTFGVAKATGATLSVRPFTGESVGIERKNDLWLEGEDVPYLTYTAGFTWDAQDVVPSVPLLMFTRADGVTPAPEIPAVIGTGPLGSGKKAQLNLAGTPMFGSLTQLYTIRIPSTAALFVPAAYASLRNGFVVPGGVAVPTVHADIEARASLPTSDPKYLDLKNYLLKVATDPDCFSATPTTAGTATAKRNSFPTSCGFIDSQTAVENFLPVSTVAPHDVWFTSPVLFFNNKAVGRTTP